MEKIRRFVEEEQGGMLRLGERGKKEDSTR